MRILRGLSLSLIALALMLLGADVVSTLERKALILRSLTQVLALFEADPTAWLTAHLGADAAEITIMVLSWPGWVTLGVLGLVLAWVVPRPPPPPGPEPEPPPPYPR
jgi:hypothetical protein